MDEKFKKQFSNLTDADQSKEATIARIQYWSNRSPYEKKSISIIELIDKIKKR